MVDDRQTVERLQGHRTHYRTARYVGVFFTVMGWTLILPGLAGSALAFWLDKDPELIGLGLAFSLACILLVVAGQLIRATLDSADRTDEILELLRAGPLQWATRPPSPTPPPSPSERTPEQSAWLKSPSTPISSDMLSSVANEHLSQCVNPFCARLLPDRDAVCPHCKTRQKQPGR